MPQRIELHALRWCENHSKFRIDGIRHSPQLRRQLEHGALAARSFPVQDGLRLTPLLPGQSELVEDFGHILNNARVAGRPMRDKALRRHT